ncbi:MAG: TonB-dependent receptor [Gemmatimonadales bacterium]|nr:TonB-dependent receptor [Gemmatimonadales bacterium]MYG19630.1 TonB-dependent receptor [Gemmatimonadales bacterium]
MTAALARLTLGAALGLGGSLLPAAAEARTQAETQAQAQGRIFDLASGAGIADAEVTWLPARGAAGSAAPGAEGSPARAPHRTSVRTNSVGVLTPDDTWGPGGGIEVSALGYLPRRLAWADAAAAGWRIGLERDPLALDEIVVTASSLPRLRSQIAVPMETVEAEEIDAAGVASADGLLAELPGVQVTAGTPVGSNLMIRGIGGARVLVLLDGQPTAGALLENRDLSRMSLAGVERVEIVKGPLSSLYGSDALGGVVNVITQLPASGFQVDARAVSGGAGRREAEATASGGGRLRYRVTGGWRQEDRIPGLADGGPSAFARVWDFRSRFQFKASDAWDLLATATYLRERQRWPVGGAFSGFNDNAGFSGSVEARRPLGAGTWSGSLFLQEYEHLFRSARGDAPIADGGDDTQWERLAKGAVGYSAVLGGHSVDVGLEVASRAIRSPDKLVEERAADQQFALFAQDAWRLGGTVVSGGARLTWNDRWGSNLSPTVGVTRRAGEHVHLRAAVARGFRAPSFKELAWNFVNVGGGYVLQGFPDLDPERSWNISGGVEWQPASTLRMEVEAFSNRIRNLIEPGFVGNAESGLLVFSPRNVADAITRGFEFSLRAVLDRAEFTAGYAYLDAYAVDSGLPLDRRAAHSARARAAWTAEALSGLRLDATAHLTGAAPIIGTGPDGSDARIGTQERFVAIDLQISVDFGRRLKLVAGVDNLFDTRPAGWQGAIERKLRMGLAVEELFAR